MGSNGGRIWSRGEGSARRGVGADVNTALGHGVWRDDGGRGMGRARRKEPCGAELKAADGESYWLAMAATGERETSGSRQRP